MKFNKWTLGLAAVGSISMASVVRADTSSDQAHIDLSKPCKFVNCPTCGHQAIFLKPGFFKCRNCGESVAG